jgi:hypothetical protein
MSEERNKAKLAIAYARAIVGDFTPAQRAALATLFFELSTPEVIEVVDALTAPDDAALERAGRAFYQRVPTEWAPTGKEFVSAMRTALDTLAGKSAATTVDAKERGPFHVLQRPQTQEDEGRYRLIDSLPSRAQAEALIEQKVEASGGWFTRHSFNIATTQG